MSGMTHHYVDFQRFFQARQNLDLVAAESWRHAAELASQVNPVITQSAKRSKKSKKSS